MFSDQEIVRPEHSTGIPLVYELSDDLKPLKHYYPRRPRKSEEAMEAVANQGKAKWSMDQFS